MFSPRWSLRRARLLVGGKLVVVVALVGYVALTWLAERVFGITGAVALSRPLSMLFAAIPAALWLGFFYLEDRHEPEPTQLVAGVFVLGALVAAPLAEFLVEVLAPAPALAPPGLPALSPDRVVYAIAVLGLAQELCKYVVVRYTVYGSPEFDEPMDGVVYMVAAGTGFAVWLNYQRFAALGHELYLSTGAAMAVITTLAHASFAGLLGYVLGRARFTRRSPLVRTVLLFFGLLGAAALNGQFTLVERWVSQAGFAPHPWKGIGYAAGFAVVVFSLLLLAARRLLADSPHRPEESR